MICDEPIIKLIQTNHKQMMMICDETIIKLIRTHHKHAKPHSCLIN